MTSTELNQKFAIVNALRFETAPGGLTRAVVSTPLAEAEIYQHGAHVAHWIPSGQKPVLFVSSKSFFAEGKAIRGGVPIIFPWFGPRSGDKPGPVHGFARTALWSVESTRLADNGAVEIVFGLEPDDASRALGFDNFSVRFTATVGRDLGLSLEVINRSGAPLELEEAMHAYYKVSDVRDVAVSGLEGTTYIDKTDGFRRKVQGDAPIRIGKETDQVHLNSVADCVISDEPWGRRIVIRKTGSHSTVVWNPWIAKAATLGDMAADEWQGMICVETANVAENAVTLEAGASHRMIATVGVE
jgi:glucose-6-phosphate 1-epimerase